MNFNEKLINLRKSKGLSQEELGNELKVFCDINQVRATGIPKYLRNAPSIMESGGISPNRMMINSVITNHVICVKVTGKGKLKSLIAYKTFSTFQIPV